MQDNQTNKPKLELLHYSWSYCHVLFNLLLVNALNNKCNDSTSSLYGMLM